MRWKEEEKIRSGVNIMARRKLKVGMVLWEVYSDPDEGVELWTYVLRTIKKNRWGTKTAYFVQKTSYTWVKKSSKHWDYGWASNISSYNRNEVSLDNYESDGLPRYLSFTRSGAYKIALKSNEEYLKDYRKDPEATQEEIDAYEKLIKTLRRMYTQYKNKGQ